MRTFETRIIQDEDGKGMVEYAMIIGFVAALMVVGSLSGLADAVNSFLEPIAQAASQGSTSVQTAESSSPGKNSDFGRKEEITPGFSEKNRDSENTLTQKVSAFIVDF